MVPDLAMVPMWSMTSSRLMPMPFVADGQRARLAVQRPTRIFSSESPSNRAGSDSASKRSLSAASEALEISSRRKMSLLEYKEWIINCSSCFDFGLEAQGFFWWWRTCLYLPLIRYKQGATGGGGGGGGFQGMVWRGSPDKIISS